METISIQIQYQISSIDELPEDIRALLDLAEQQLEMSYAPYSNFNVGAALRLENNKVFSGCNQENAAYPLCICGERVALYSAGSQYPDMPIKALCISARNNIKKLAIPVAPCGACRQVIKEFQDKTEHPFPIYIKAFDINKVIKYNNAEDLLPFSFSKEYLI